jgi:hypothetical protein
LAARSCPVAAHRPDTPPLITRPDDTAWEDGTFKLSVEFTEEYPNKAPTVSAPRGVRIAPSRVAHARSSPTTAPVASQSSSPRCSTRTVRRAPWAVPRVPSRAVSCHRHARAVLCPHLPSPPAKPHSTPSSLRSDLRLSTSASPPAPSAPHPQSTPTARSAWTSCRTSGRPSMISPPSWCALTLTLTPAASLLLAPASTLTSPSWCAASPRPPRPPRPAEPAPPAPPC